MSVKVKQVDGAEATANKGVASGYASLDATVHVPLDQLQPTAVRIGSTENLALSGLAAIDGVTPVAGDLILVKNQTTQSANGIYTAAAGAWSRTPAFSTSAQVLSGLRVFISEGGQAEQWFVLATANPIVLGTTALSIIPEKTKLTAVAGWVGLRYFAVDYDSGLDTNLGYSDTSMAEAGTRAIKTFDQLKKILPLNGVGQRAHIAIKARAAGATYRNQANTADAELDFLIGVSGYLQLIVRGTGTVVSAGATAFANDTADKICCGSQIFAGTNAAGYNPTGAPTTSVFDCTLAGGGAPGLAAEPGLIGKRIRFDSATTTVALRNATGMIWANDTDTITLGANLPAVPVGTDVFYIEEPATAVNRIVAQTSNGSNIAVPPSFTQSGIQIVGLKAVSAVQAVVSIRGAAALINLSFIDVPNSTGFSAVTCTGVIDLRMTNTYSDDAVAPATITTGAGVRSGGGITCSQINTVNIALSACIAARFQILSAYQFTIGSGCFSLMGALVQGGGTSTATTSLGGNVVGNNGSTTQRRLRTTSTFTESISVTRTDAVLYGIDITGVGATPCIQVNGIGSRIMIQDVVGTTGNTGFGINLVNARDCRLVMGTLAANTFAGAAGQDIHGGGPVDYVHADYARTDLRDNNGNHIQGSAGSIVGPTTVAINNAVANVGQYAIVRATGSGVVQAAQADTAANAAGVVGVSQSPFTAAGPQLSMLVNGGGTWVQFDAGPTAGGIAYLSTATAGNAQDTAPALAGTNRKLRLGRILRVSGTLGFVAWSPEMLSVLADGLA